MATLEGANAKGNAGIALGSTAVGIELLRALGGGGIGGILGNLTGSGNGNGAATMAAAGAALAAGLANGGKSCCSEDHCVDRYEAQQDAQMRVEGLKRWCEVAKRKIGNDEIGEAMIDMFCDQREEIEKNLMKI